MVTLFGQILVPPLVFVSGLARIGDAVKRGRQSRVLVADADGVGVTAEHQRRPWSAPLEHGDDVGTARRHLGEMVFEEKGDERRDERIGSALRVYRDTLAELRDQETILQARESR